VIYTTAPSTVRTTSVVSPNLKICPEGVIIQKIRECTGNGKEDGVHVCYAIGIA
jgi:hypothetical protein